MLSVRGLDLTGPVSVVVREDFLDVEAGLPERRYLLMPLHPILTRIIRGQGQSQIAIETVEQIAEMFGAASDILDRIERVAYLERRRRARHQLHQPLCPRPRHGGGVEVRLGLDDRSQEGGMQPILPGIPGDGLLQFALRDAGSNGSGSERKRLIASI